MRAFLGHLCPPLNTREIDTIAFAGSQVEEELHSRENMEESVTQVDFDQLKIKNNEFQKYVQRGNEMLLKEKFNVTMATRTNNQLHHKLKEANGETREVDTAISTFRRLIDVISREQRNIDEELKFAKQEYKEKVEQLSLYRAPDVLAYVAEKAQIQTERYEIHLWEERLNVASAEMQHAKRVWNQYASSLNYRMAEMHSSASPILS